jgi:predicted RNA-binding Zn ribbon-like protein
VHIRSATETETRLTIEVTLDLVNGLDELDVRDTLLDAGFSRSASASTASLRRLEDRLRELEPLIRSLPDLEVDDAARRFNEELTELPIAPAVVDHDGVGPHLHWTASTARFDDQVVADILMAFAQELCDNGTDRFGRCAAHDCEDVFYDATRNHSKRFCADPRCASRTHTADHRARQAADDG